jgi:hypothetical protein
MLFVIQAKPLTAHALGVVKGPSVEVGVNDATPMQEVHIANNGMMLLRGATVVSIDADIIRVAMDFGPSHFTWQIQNNSGTKFTSSSGVAESRADIKTGDMITVTGTLVYGGNDPLIHAVYIRESSQIMQL